MSDLTALTIETTLFCGLTLAGARLALTCLISRSFLPLRTLVHISLTATASLLLAVPAYAADSVALPAPNGITLLALGLAGLIIGRRAASKRDGE